MRRWTGDWDFNHGFPYLSFFCILILISDFALAVIDHDGRFQF